MRGADSTFGVRRSPLVDGTGGCLPLTWIGPSALFDGVSLTIFFLFSNRRARRPEPIVTPTRRRADRPRLDRSRAPDPFPGVGPALTSDNLFLTPDSRPPVGGRLDSKSRHRDVRSDERLPRCAGPRDARRAPGPIHPRYPRYPRPRARGALRRQGERRPQRGVRRWVAPERQGWHPGRRPTRPHARHRRVADGRPAPLPRPVRSRPSRRRVQAHPGFLSKPRRRHRLRQGLRRGHRGDRAHRHKGAQGARGHGHRRTAHEPHAVYHPGQVRAEGTLRQGRRPPRRLQIGRRRG